MPYPQEEADRVRKDRVEAGQQTKQAMENMAKALEELRNAYRERGRASKAEMEFLHKMMADLYAKVEGQQ